MNIAVAFYSAILFFILTPNVAVRLPSNGSKMTVAMVHAAIFGIILYFTQNIVHQFSRKVVEGAKVKASPLARPRAPPAHAGWYTNRGRNENPLVTLTRTGPALEKGLTSVARAFNMF